jgi:hypothetical protein
MKKLILMLGLSLFYLIPKAQEKIQTMSNVEKFCQTPGRTITGYLVYTDSYGWAHTGVTAMAMKYIDSSAKDTMYGVTFTYYNNNTAGECNVYKYYSIMVDYEEINKVISWLEANQWLSSSAGAKIGFLSYVPEKGNFMLKLERRINQKGSSYSSNYWEFSIRASKYDIDSEKSFAVDLKIVIENLKKLQGMIKENS